MYHYKEVPIETVPEVTMKGILFGIRAGKDTLSMPLTDSYLGFFKHTDTQEDMFPATKTKCMRFAIGGSDFRKAKGMSYGFYFYHKLNFRDALYESSRMLWEFVKHTYGKEPMSFDDYSIFCAMMLTTYHNFPRHMFSDTHAINQN